MFKTLSPREVVFIRHTCSDNITSSYKISTIGGISKWGHLFMKPCEFYSEHESRESTRIMQESEEFTTVEVYNWWLVQLLVLCYFIIWRKFLKMFKLDNI